MNREIPPKTWFVVTLSMMLAGAASVALAVFIVDPFQYYRKPSFYRPVYQNPYYSMPGLIRNHEYDAVVVGSSMAQNFRLSDIREHLGWNAVKLTPPGCYAATAKLLLDMSLREDRARHVLLGFDVPVFAAAVDDHRTTLPMYLYDQNPWNDVRYLWNKDVITEAMGEVLKANLSDRPKYRARTDPDRMWAWDLGLGRRDYGWETVRSEDAEHPLDLTPFAQASLEHVTENFRVNLLAPMLEHSDAEFIVFFPPYSILFWKHARDTGCLEKMIEFKQRVVERLAELPNVRVVDFQTATSIIVDFDNYKDTSHFSPEISRWMLERIAAGDNVATAVDVQAELDFFLGLIREFESRLNPVESGGIVEPHPAQRQDIQLGVNHER